MSHFNWFPNYLQHRQVIHCRLVLVGPIVFENGRNHLDTRHITVDRICPDGTTGERMGIFLEGEAAHCAAFKLDRQMCIEYVVDRKYGRIAEALW